MGLQRVGDDRAAGQAHVHVIVFGGEFPRSRMPGLTRMHMKNVIRYCQIALE